MVRHLHDKTWNKDQRTVDSYYYSVIKGKEMKKNNGWNYRVIKVADKKLKGLPQTYSFGIYEVYYKDNIAHSWSAEPQYPIGESWIELYQDYHRMVEAFTKKVMYIKDGKLKEGRTFMTI